MSPSFRGRGDAHPAWCTREHDGVVHRRPVGAVTVDGRTLGVVLSQPPGGELSVLVSGSLYVAFAPEDSADMAELMRLLGQPELGVLIGQAAEHASGERAVVA